MRIFCLTLITLSVLTGNSICYNVKLGNEVNVTFHTQPNFKGDFFLVTGLNGIGDCKGVVKPGLFDPLDWTKFNEKSQSISLGVGVCVRLFEHDCNWTIKGKILDTTSNSTWVGNLALAGFNGIVSAVQLIECPSSHPPLVSIYAGTNQQGEKMDLTGLEKIGDCEVFWSSKNYNVMISEHFRRFDNKPKSIKIKDGVCVRLFEHDCGWTVKGKILDTMSHSPWANDFGSAGFNGIVSAVKLIECPPGSNREALVSLFSGIDYSGDSVDLYELQKIGDNVEFSNGRGYNVIISEHLRRFDNKGRSIKLRDGVCVRLFEHDCDWNTKGKILDVTPNSSWTSDFAQMGFNGIISCVQMIECPPDGVPLVSLYSGIYYTGDRVDLYKLKEVGDCEELWSPFGMNVMISEDMRRIDNKVNSIKIKDGVCVRLYEHACESNSRILDTTSNSPWVSDLFKGTFNTILTGIEIIECPHPSRITVYNSKNLQGTALELFGLQKIGDCVEFWNPGGFDATISDDLRQFNDKVHSIKISPGLCISLHEGHCAVPGKTLVNVTSDSQWTKNLNRKSFGGKVTSVKLTCDESPPTPAPTPTTPISTLSPITGIQDTCNCTCDKDYDNEISPTTRTYYVVQNDDEQSRASGLSDLLPTLPSQIPYSGVSNIIGFLKCMNITEDMVKETGTIYQYHIQGTTKTTDLYLDFLNLPGKIDIGKPTQGADVVLNIKEEDFIKFIHVLSNEGFLSWWSMHSVVKGTTYQGLTLYTTLRKLLDGYPEINHLNPPKSC